MTYNYADDMLVNISDDGMTDDLWQLAYDDGSKLSKLEVSNERERNLYFYLENFIDDLCEEFGHDKIKNHDEVVQKAFNILRKKEEIDLTDIRKAIFGALQMQKAAANKKAYPNTRGSVGDNAKPQRDIEKWVHALGSIYAAMQSGESKNIAMQRITEEWSPMEKLDFENWARYYEQGDYEKYGINKSAADLPQPPVMPKQLQLQEMPVRRGPGRPRKLIQSLEEKKRSLISRIDSAIRLLREFANVWPDDVWLRMMSSLNDLQAQIPRLRTEATMRDCIIRVAKQFEKEGFSEGASVLIKVAQPPAEDIASRIEKALTGREYEGGDAPALPAGEEIPPPPGMEEGMGEMPPAPAGEAGMEAVPPAGVAEELPPPEMPPPAPKEEKSEEPSVDDNPFKDKNLTVQDVLNVLEPLSKKLSEREFVRALSKADMMLDSMNIASHFPELGEAQSKALELNIYVGNRIDKVINKLKGGLKGEEEKEGGPPEIEMGEFAAEPGKEKEMFEVTEEAAPEAPTLPGTPPPAGGTPPAPPAGV